MTVANLNNNGKIIIGFAAIIVAVIIVMNATAPTPQLVSQSPILNPGDNVDPIIESKQSSEFDDMWELMDIMMADVARDDEKLEQLSNLVYLHARNNKNEVLWNPEGLQITALYESKPNELYHGFVNSPENSIYVGPIIFWWRENEGDKILYEASFSVVHEGVMSSWRNSKPYEYGILTYPDPPPEIIKVLSDNNIKLIY